MCGVVAFEAARAHRRGYSVNPVRRTADPTQARHGPSKAQPQAGIGAAPQHISPELTAAYFSHSREVFIHIGKTGGGSIYKTFRFRRRVHIRPVEMRDLRGYNAFIVIRDPIARLISAFNWRKYDQCSIHATNCHQNERDLFSCYRTLNSFAEGAAQEQDCSTLALDVIQHPTESGHIGMGYAYYFHKVNFTDVKCRLFTARTENLMDGLQDFARLVGHPHRLVTASPRRVHSSYPQRNDTFVSERGRRNLELVLSADYEIYNSLSLSFTDRGVTTVRPPGFR